ncbi:MAG: L,D-transpeptidase [Gaiellaceae bacterium]
MQLNYQAVRRRVAKASLLVVAACFVSVAAAAGPEKSSPSTVAASAKAAAYPKTGVILWTKLAAHTKPSRTSPTIKVFPQFRSDFRPTTLLVLGQTKDAKGRVWLKLSMPMRPNGRIGWVLAAAVQTKSVRRTIVIDLSSRMLRILEGGKTRFATRVAIGRPGMETPTGNYYVTAAFKPTERYLGSFAFETSAYSKLSEWPGGGVVGLHGTSTPSLLGQAVSHGCVRMSNAAALVLRRLTPAGTPLKIVA